MASAPVRSWRTTRPRRAVVVTLGLSATLTLSGCDDRAESSFARPCALERPALPSARLTTDGARFRDALGRVIALRGVNAGGRSKFAPFMPFDFAEGGDFDAALAAYMDRAASWGIDVLRVPFTWAAVEPTRGADDPVYLARYDALLDAAWARGMRSIVDFHQDIYAEVFCGDGFPAWTLPGETPAPRHDCPDWALRYFNDANVMAAFDRLWAPGSPVQRDMIALWDRMVARYKERPGVIGFEIINEPGHGSGDPDAFEATTLSAFYAQMVGRIRGAAPEALVFVDPPGVNGITLITKLTRPPGEGVVFAPHYYPIARDPDGVRLGLANWAAVGAAWSAPVLVGEFGSPHDELESAPYLTTVWDGFDALGLSGTQWEYSVAREGWNEEKLGVVAPDGTEHATAAPIVRPFSRAVAGDVEAVSFDAAARTFELRFVSRAAGTRISEIAVPARIYEGGFDIEVQNGCYDASRAGEVLVRADADGARVEVRVKPR